MKLKKLKKAIKKQHKICVKADEQYCNNCKTRYCEYLNDIWEIKPKEYIKALKKLIKEINK